MAVLRPAAGIVVAVAVLLAGAAAARAHGGQYRPPVEDPPRDVSDPPLPAGEAPPPDGGGGTPTPPPAEAPPPPDGGGGTPTPPPSSQVPPPPDGGDGTPTLPPGGGGPPVPRTPGSGPGRVATPAPWERWWEAHRERILGLRARVRERDLGTVTPDPTPGAPIPDAAEAARAAAEEVLRRALRDRDAEVRSAAAVALGKQGSARCLHDLLRARTDRVRDVREGALLGLGFLGDRLAAEEIGSVLFDPTADLREREFAAVALGVLGGREATTLLLRFLDPASDRERAGGLRRTDGVLAATVLGLGASGDAAAVEPLRAAYASTVRLPERARALAAVALARLGDRRSLPMFRQALAMDAEPLRLTACTAIGILAGPDDAELVGLVARIALEDHNADVRLAAQAALGRARSDAARQGLRRVLERGKSTDAPMAALALGIAGDAAAAPELLRRFRREGDPRERGAYALALGLLGHAGAAREIREAAFSRGDVALRAHCLAAAGLLGDAAAADAARALVATERDPDLRLAAAVCLGLLRDRAVVPVVEGMVRSGGTTWERAASCVLLGHVGNRRSVEVLASVVDARAERGPVRVFAAAGLGTLTARDDLHPLVRVTEDQHLDSLPGALGALSSLL